MPSNLVKSSRPKGFTYRTAVLLMKPTHTWSRVMPQLLTRGHDGVKINNLFRHPLTKEVGCFHFDNGSPMSHVKVVGVQSLSTNPMVLDEHDWTTIYIPRVISGDLFPHLWEPEDELASFFQSLLKIGHVSHVEFRCEVDINLTSRVLCAYIHFHNWYDNHLARRIRNIIEYYHCHGFQDAFGFHTFSQSSIILQNNKP